VCKGSAFWAILQENEQKSTFFHTILANRHPHLTYIVYLCNHKIFNQLKVGWLNEDKEVQEDIAS